MSPGQTVEAILFDLAEVYLTGLKGTHTRLEPRLDAPVEEAALLGEHATRLFHGEISEVEYWRGLIDANGWKVEVDDLRRLARENFVRIDGTEQIVRELKESGYPLGLLSIHAREWVEYCEREFDHHRYFDAVVYSYECGLSKPDRRAYERALEALGARAENTLFIDDAEENVQAARELGMQAIQFLDAERLAVQLAEMGVLPRRT